MFQGSWQQWFAVGECLVETTAAVVAEDGTFDLDYLEPSFLDWQMKGSAEAQH